MLVLQVCLVLIGVFWLDKIHLSTNIVADKIREYDVVTKVRKAVINIVDDRVSISILIVPLS